MKNLQSVTVLTEIVPCRLFHFSVSPLNSLIFCFLNVLILSVLRLHKLSKLPYATIHFTVISVLQSSVKSIGKCTKKYLHNNQNNIFSLLIYSLCCYEWFLFVHNFCVSCLYNWAIVAIWSLLFVNKYTPLVGVY